MRKLLAISRRCVVWLLRIKWLSRALIPGSYWLSCALRSSRRVFTHFWEHKNTSIDCSLSSSCLTFVIQPVSFLLLEWISISFSYHKKSNRPSYVTGSPKISPAWQGRPVSFLCQRNAKILPMSQWVNFPFAVEGSHGSCSLVYFNSCLAGLQ